MSLESKITLLETELKKLKNKTQSNDNDLADINIASPEVSKILDQLSKRVNFLEAQNTEIKKNISNLEDKNLKADEKIDKVGEKIEKLDLKKCDSRYVEAILESKVDKKELNLNRRFSKTSSKRLPFWRQSLVIVRWRFHQ